MIVNNRLLAMNHLVQNLRRLHCSSVKRGYEGSGKSTINILNKADTKLFITTCSPAGFQLNDNSIVLGPLVIFPKTILSWNVKSGKDINEASLSLFMHLEPKLDVLVLGIETAVDYALMMEIKKIMTARNISIEVLPTDRACGVYNFLCEEGRYVAAGLIPMLPESTFTYQKLLSNMAIINKSPMIDSK